jgi:putative NADPH-quinone reductase
LAEADVLALASPLYWFVFSAQLKAALDKFYAFMEPRTKKKPILKEAVLLMTAWYSRPEAYCGAIGTYRETCRYLGLRDRGIITVASVYDVGAIAGNDALKQARELGASL